MLDLKYGQILMESFHLFQNRRYDLHGCAVDSPIWKVFRGYGHSYHTQCLVPKISSGPLCLTVVARSMQTLAEKANHAVFNVENDDNKENYDNEEDESDSKGEEVEEDDLADILPTDADEGAMNKHVDKIVQEILRWRRPVVDKR